MNDYIKEMAASLPDCVVIVLPMDLEIEPIEDITFERHDEELVEYWDVNGTVLARHTVISI